MTFYLVYEQDGTSICASAKMIYWNSSKEWAVARAKQRAKRNSWVSTYVYELDDRTQEGKTVWSSTGIPT